MSNKDIISISEQKRLCELAAAAYVASLVHISPLLRTTHASAFKTGFNSSMDLIRSSGLLTKAAPAVATEPATDSVVEAQKQENEIPVGATSLPAVQENLNSELKDA